MLPKVYSISIKNWLLSCQSCAIILSYFDGQGGYGLVFGDKLQILRKEKGFTQDALAAEIGVSRQAISKWESGCAYPDLDNAQILCKYFCVNINTLFNPEINEISREANENIEFNYSAVGSNIKEIRTSKGISQEGLGEILGVSRQSVSRWESGAAIPKTDILIELISVLDTDFNRLFKIEAPDPVHKKSDGVAKNKKLLTLALCILGALLIAVIVILTLTIDSNGGNVDIPQSTSGPLPTADMYWQGNVDTSWYHEQQTSFRIKSASQLAGLAQIVNSGKDSFSGKTVHIDNDIILNPNIEWTPIGSGAKFSGTIVGNGHAVYYLKITSAQGASGLFGEIEDASIKKLNVLFPDVSGRTETGIICGKASGSILISGCTIDSASLSGTECVGAIAGKIITHKGAEISHCIINGSLNGSRSVGGICGQAIVIGNGTIAISNNLVNGFIENSSRGGEHCFGFGGIVGYMQAEEVSFASLYQCESNADICAKTEEKSEYIGGIIGACFNDGSNMVIISESYSTGNIGGKAEITDAGGILGIFYGNNTAISYCYSSCNIRASACCGGICGSLIMQNSTASVESCAFIGEIHSVFSENADSFGGIIGSTDSGNYTVSIKNCCINGSIYAPLNGAVVGNPGCGSMLVEKCLYTQSAGKSICCEKYFVNNISCSLKPQKSLTDAIIFHEKIAWKTDGWQVDRDVPILAFS